MSGADLLTLGTRILLVALFLPFSALDKTLNFHGAVGQAREVAPSEGLAKILIAAGLGVEIVMPLLIVTGVADRAAALVMALYCVATAALFKRFWEPGDFWARGDSQARTLFWDFWKNVALAAGFLLITLGPTARGVGALFADPLGSTHPYGTVPHG